jgi:hypothetical protein
VLEVGVAVLRVDERVKLDGNAVHQRAVAQIAALRTASHGAGTLQHEGEACNDTLKQ